MKNGLRGLYVLLVITIVLTVPGLAKADDSAKNLPNIDYLVRIARMTSDWGTPPRGACRQRYIKDISTGKTYLVEVGYWSSPVIPSEFQRVYYGPKTSHP